MQPAQAHQLPPTVQIAMVAIDEASAMRLANGSTPPPEIDEAVARRADFFHLPATSRRTLQKLEALLAKHHIRYRVFSTTVALPESR